MTPSCAQSGFDFESSHDLPAGEPVMSSGKAMDVHESMLKALG